QQAQGGQDIKRGGRAKRSPGGSLSDAINTFSKERNAQLTRSGPSTDAATQMMLARMYGYHPQLAVAEQAQGPRREIVQPMTDLGNQIDEGAKWLAGETAPDESVATTKGNSKPGAAGGGGALPVILAGIRHMETGGLKNPYGYVSPAGALGAYGIMPKTLASWAERAGYKGISPQDFISNPDAQDAVAAVGARDYYNQYGGDVRSVGQAWLGGPGSVGKRVKDPWTGISTADYGNRLNDYVGQNYQPQTENAQSAPAAPVPPPPPPPQPSDVPNAPQAQADPMSNLYDKVAFSPDVQSGYD